MSVIDIREVEEDIAQLERAQAEMQFYIDEWKNLCTILKEKGFEFERNSNTGKWIMPISIVTYSERISKKIQ